MQKTFHYSFKNKLFKVECNGIEMFFAENPFHLFQRDRDYFLQYKLKEGDTAIDAGAFIGVFSIYASKLVGTTGKVFSFEPDLNMLKRFRKHVELNNATNIHVIEKGLWSTETTLVFRGGLELGSSFIKGDDEGETIKLPVTSVDAVLGNQQVTGQLFIKMNIEGSEIEAVKGAAQTIQKYKPYFAIRTNHMVEGSFTDKRVEEELKTFNYKVKTLEQGVVELTTYGQPA